MISDTFEINIFLKIVDRRQWLAEGDKSFKGHGWLWPRAHTGTSKSLERRGSDKAARGCSRIRSDLYQFPAFIRDQSCCVEEPKMTNILA